jgi:hypothetical protein
METKQGISLCSYLYLKLAKMPHFSFYLLYFFFYKIGEQKGGTDSVQGGEREGGSERSRRMSMMQIMCTHVCKNDTC